MAPIRTALDHSQRYEPIGLRPSSKHEGRRGPWSPAEDDLLRRLVNQHGAGNWVAIQNGIQSRTAKQCRERWHQNLDPKLNHDPITPEEGRLIEELVTKDGKRWADIARHLPGRSDNAVKNWWNGGENRRRREQARQEAIYYHQPQHYIAPSQHWQGLPSPSYSQQYPVYHQLPPPSFHRVGHTLPPLVTPMQRPSPIMIPHGGVPRDQPSPAYSLPSMTEDPASPQSYTATRRDSLAQLPPLQKYQPEVMVRSQSNGSSRSSHSPVIDVRAEMAQCLPPRENAGSLPGVSAILAGPPPPMKELGYLVKVASPIGQSLPSLSNINR